MAVREYSVTVDDFPTKLEQDVFEFIMNYANENGNQTPDYRTVIEKFPDFYYREGVTDSYRYLVGELKSYAAKKSIVNLFAGTPDERGKPTKPTLEERINKEDGNKVIEDLISELESIKIRTNVRKNIGTNLKLDKNKILDEYYSRKIGKSHRVWKSFLPMINDVGGYVSSSMYVSYGKSGRGKSAVTLKEAVNLADQGATVLIWSMEMSWFEVYVRIFTYYSQMKGGISTAEVKGINMDVGFDSSDLRRGNLNEEFERKFFEFLDNIDELMSGNIIVRAVDDDDFNDRSIRALEHDIMQTNADVVVIDPFYYMDYEANTSRKTGGDAENTSKALRRLAGRTDVVVLAITQADETDEEKDDNGSRELKLPQRKDVKKTKQLLEDAAMLIAVDTNYLDGRGLVGINKGRDGGEGEVTEIIYLPQYGIIEPLSLEDTELIEAIEEF